MSALFFPEAQQLAVTPGNGNKPSGGAVLQDAELERHIASCGYLMLEAYKRYEQSHCFSDKGEADRWMLLMNEAIKGRSAAQVTRMEQERGLA